LPSGGSAAVEKDTGSDRIGHTEKTIINFNRVFIVTPTPIFLTIWYVVWTEYTDFMKIGQPKVLERVKRRLVVTPTSLQLKIVLIGEDYGL
jgi:hypothetical protein